MPCPITWSSALTDTGKLPPDVGGCDKIRPLWRHYFQNTHGVVAFVDSNDRDRLDEVSGMPHEVRKEVLALMDAPELRDAFCLVIANKQDLPCAMPPREVSEKLQLPRAMGSRLWTCLPGQLGSMQLTNAHFDWLASALRHTLEQKRFPTTSINNQQQQEQEPGLGDNSGGDAVAAAAPPAGVAAEHSVTAATSSSGPGPGNGGPNGGGGELDVLERWLSAEDEPDEEFLMKLENYSLDCWDHRTHLRLAWLYLTRLGRREGLARIHASIRAFIQHSPLTARRSGTTYHETMTYFWAHMVHFAIASQKVPAGASPDFRVFLLMNPQLTNGGLFLHYYSKQLMLQSPESRIRVVLPDKRPLPSIITDLSTLRRGTTTSAASQAPGPLTDAEFLDRFLGRSLDRWNHECLLRAVYCCLKRHGRRRGGDVALDGLRALQGPDFHLTICYFWLCLLTHTLASEYHAALFTDRPAKAAEGTAVETNSGIASGGVVAKALPEWPELLGQSGYTAVRLKELVADERRYLHYYSNKVVFLAAAATTFVPPDKRPLPSTT
ncbi:hypothetical protein VOLCADRAFT_88144 [Volvox carteri f. nagariensis]|uniref:ADP-ribosylation factor n=1 Tax=Volvox carteri f. nagariensis TaxID=3068 RepID=D8TNE2_VOLCA|nr:uncharacterized protein VOLCADRAFT_88144 [Volvox carteri f. nagariensis]EFJ50977.1 hypothetical protein VOLCADRAFT_88144 [Volvox carteri f. nagariensis]|eukprot:XP_002947989.1 hypothetical protein VOLCADRAFT_88144 [Volvox carteri f. nagariensis]